MLPLHKNGPLIMFLSTFLFGFMVLLVKIATHTLPAVEITLARFSLGLVLLCFLVILRIIKLEAKNKVLLIWRGILGGTAILLYFIAISKIPLAIATILNFTFPIFATIFSAIYLKESLRVPTIITLILSFIGIVLIVNPMFVHFNIGYVFGLLAGVVAGGDMVTIRGLRKTDSSWMILFALLLAGTIFSAFIGAPTLKVPLFNQWILLIAIAILGALGQLLMAYAFKYCRTSEGSIVSLFMVVVAAILAYLVLGERFTLLSMTGGLLILGSGIYLMVNQAPQDSL